MDALATAPPLQHASVHSKLNCAKHSVHSKLNCAKHSVHSKLNCAKHSVHSKLNRAKHHFCSTVARNGACLSFVESFGSVLLSSLGSVAIAFVVSFAF